MLSFLFSIFEDTRLVVTSSSSSLPCPYLTFKASYLARSFSPTLGLIVAKAFSKCLSSTTPWLLPPSHLPAPLGLLAPHQQSQRTGRPRTSLRRAGDRVSLHLRSSHGVAPAPAEAGQDHLHPP